MWFGFRFRHVYVAMLMGRHIMISCSESSLKKEPVRIGAEEQPNRVLL